MEKKGKLGHSLFDRLVAELGEREVKWKDLEAIIGSRKILQKLAAFSKTKVPVLEKSGKFLVEKSGNIIATCKSSEWLTDPEEFDIDLTDFESFEADAVAIYVPLLKAGVTKEGLTLRKMDHWHWILDLPNAEVE